MSEFELRRIECSGIDVEYFQISPGSFPNLPVHGFTGVSANFRAPAIDADAESLCAHYQAKSLLVVKQVHGVDFIEANAADLRRQWDGSKVVELGQADAIVGKRSGWDSKVLIGVRTADCVPLIVYSSSVAAVVHAGWRGLATGIVQRVCSWLMEHSLDAEYNVLIGPHAGPQAYEVGQEVVDQFGGRATSHKLPSGKHMLDLESSARAIIESMLPASTQIYSSGKCTIGDRAYHSYRRNGPGVGSNLSFFLLCND